jgi:hypothetical protein
MVMMLQRAPLVPTANRRPVPRLDGQFPWRRREGRPLRTRGLALGLVLLVASMAASSELHASTLVHVLLGLGAVVVLGTAIVGGRQERA